MVFGKPKVGVYSPVAFNPMFLRMLMLQLAHQSYRPSVVAIHENGLPQSYFQWSCGDVVTTMESQGTKVLYKHSPKVISKCQRFGVPLKMLLDEGCDLFIKCDSDDFYYKSHIKELMRLFTKAKADCVVNSNNSVMLLRVPQHDHQHDALAKNPPTLRYWPIADFGNINGLGGMANNVIFNRKVAEAFYLAMEAADKQYEDGSCEMIADDVVLFNLLPQFIKTEICGLVTCCYCSHGNNVSSAIWQTVNPDDLPFD
jgi:hypothetical protein